MNLRTILALVMSTALSTIAFEASAQAASPAAASQQMRETKGTGAWPAIKEQVASLPGYVVYRPENLNGLGGRKLGIYLFGNGGCELDGTKSRLHLLEIASHGYIAIAPGGIHAGPGATPRPPKPRPDLGAGFKSETPLDVLAGALDWALRENARKDSPLYQKIDPTQIASSGYSCGGLQALYMRKDPRVKTFVMMYSGLFPDGSDRLGGMAPDKASLGTLNGSILYVLGGPEDIAYANGMDDFQKINHIPAAVVNIPVGHGGTFEQPNGGLGAKIVVDWLNWRLRGEAAAQFRGADCGLCKDANVTIETKNVD